MLEPGQFYKTATWRVELDPGTGDPRWCGGGAGAKAEMTLGPGKPLSLNPSRFPPGTQVVVYEANQYQNDP